jgi:hypothetical protein
MNVKSKYFLVNVPGHGTFYAHRIVYYLQHGENPGSLVVRHTCDDELILGYQDDNLRDQKGATYKTRRMYEYNGNQYSLRALCRVLELNYHSVYFQIRKSGNVRKVLDMFRVEGVTLLFDE